VSYNQVFFLFAEFHPGDDIRGRCSDGRHVYRLYWEIQGKLATLYLHLFNSISFAPLVDLSVQQ